MLHMQPNEHRSLKHQIQRTPRLVPSYPEGELKLEDPARPTTKPTISWLSILLPPLVMLTITIFVSTFTRSVYILVMTMGMTLVSVLVSVLNYSSNVKNHHQKNKKLTRKYTDYLFQVRNELVEASNQQRNAMSFIHPSVEGCYDIARHQRKQLWERTAIENDFLEIRIGIGERGMGRVPQYTPKSRAVDEENPAERIAVQICEEWQRVRDVPFSLPLTDISTLGFFGKRSEVRSFVYAFITQVTTHHGYDDIRLIGLIRPGELEEWDWIRWLPHTWGKDRKVRFLAASPNEAIELADLLLPVLRTREQSKNVNMISRKTRLPHLVVLMLAPEFWEQSEIMKYVLANDMNLAMTSVFISEKIDYELPLNCQVIVEVKDGTGCIRKDVHHRLDEAGKTFRADLAGLEASDAYARSLAPIRLKDLDDHGHIPTMVTFLDSFDVKSVEELRLTERWEQHKANRSLAVPLGRGQAGKMLIFDLHEKAYGPHGLVAGTTGSGKSELLQSLLLALAVNYHPHEVAFVLIDYKGGGMANAFTGIPHLVGTITNLSGNQILRALASIKSELQRRQRLFSEVDVTNIDDYIVMARKDSLLEPLPHLLMVVDEFAELKSDQPEFMKELVSAARVGRSLGIHLILATQKPSGVVDDQIWSNSRFKLCLKVQTTADSQEMLKRPEAAEITEKGRGYLQVGNNEVFTLFQSSWSGAPYEEKGSTKTTGGQAYVVGLQGSRAPLVWSQPKEQSEKKPTQLQVVVNQIVKQSELHGVQRAFQLWQPPLPTKVHLNQLIEKEQNWNGREWETATDYLVIPIGIVDHPMRQVQFPLKIDFSRNGHLLIYGLPGTGKTMLLKTIMMALALKYSPDDIHMYILDFGTRTLGVFRNLPHVGEVVYPEDEEKLEKLLSWMLGELEIRKRKFAERGISNLVSYRTATGEQVPAILIVLDNYTNFQEASIDRVTDIVKLVREGGNYGFYFVSAANAVNSFPYRITQNVTQMLVFQLSERSEYTAIVGRTNGLEPEKTPGRGLAKDSTPLEFQAALPAEGLSDDQVSESIRMQCDAMKAVFHKPVAQSISVAESVTIQELLFKTKESLTTEQLQTAFPIGLNMENIQPVIVDLRRTAVCAISYVNAAEASSQLECLVRTLAASFQKVKFGIVASEGMKSLNGETGSSWEEKRLSTGIELLAYTSAVISELQERKNDSRQAAVCAVEHDEADYIASRYPLIVIVIPNLKSAIHWMDDESLGHVERIARYGSGLGVLLLVGSTAEEWLQLKMTVFVKLLMDQRHTLLSGGLLKEHGAFIDDLKDNGLEINKRIGEGEAYFLLEDMHYRVKLPISMDKI
ncbi:type VII secretion protein EssC [Paenibacillus turpanensis]|uniref:type VII secretion protein EssC n=1 Tax=Paenibacillus turpanensis TaxID=2689078 RepID=UPI00140823D6|nr:type VII secretion protein EssC [Paenibacillus turpanensis]